MEFFGSLKYTIMSSASSDNFNSFLRDLKRLSYKSFTCLVRVTPRYFILFVMIVKGVVSLISLSVHLSFV